MSYIVTKVIIKDNLVKLVVEDETCKIDLKISINDYLNHPYRLNQEISNNQLDELKEAHTYFYALNKCLRKLSCTDYSKKEIVDLLKKVDGLKESDANKIVEYLQTIGYLSDELVSQSQLYVDQNKLLGKRKTRYTLIKRGVDLAQVTNTLEQVSQEDELERGLKKAKLIQKRIKGKSSKEKLALIRSKLLMDGFENVEEIMANLDLKADLDDEQTNLDLAFAKILKKYRLKYQGSELKQNLCKYLLNKGYNWEMINETLRKWETENED